MSEHVANLSSQCGLGTWNRLQHSERGRNGYTQLRELSPNPLRRHAEPGFLWHVTPFLSFTKLCFVLQGQAQGLCFVGQGQAQGNSLCSTHLAATVLSFHSGLKGGTHH